MDRHGREVLGGDRRRDRDRRACPPDSYGLTLRTQIQGGNAPDVFVVSPGAGQDNAVLPLAEAGFVEPLGQASTDLIPEGNEGLFQLDGETYAQPTDIIPVGMLWNVGAASDAGVDVPEDTDALIDVVRAARRRGQVLLRHRRFRAAQPGPDDHGDLRDPRVRRDPGLERSSAPPATSPSPTTRAGRRPCRRSST